MSVKSTLQQKLESAASAYDRKQANKRGYNTYALGQYLLRIDEVMEEINSGKSPREAIMTNFNDRLRDALLTAIGEPKA